MSTFNQCVTVEDSLATARRMAQLPETSAIRNQFVRNLSTVLFSPQAAIEARRNAYACLQRSAEPEAKAVLDAYAESGLTLDEKLKAPECSYNSRG